MCPNNTLLPTLSEPRPLEGRCLHKRWPVVAAGLDPLHNASAAEVWLGPRTRPIESEIEGYASEPIPGCRGPQTYPHLITSFAPPSPDTSCNSEGGACFSDRPHSCSIEHSPPQATPSSIRCFGAPLHRAIRPDGRRCARVPSPSPCLVHARTPRLCVQRPCSMMCATPHAQEPQIPLAPAYLRALPPQEAQRTSS